MKTRRHHNNKGTRQIARGKCAYQLRSIAIRCGLRSAVDKPNKPALARAAPYEEAHVWCD